MFVITWVRGSAAVMLLASALLLGGCGSEEPDVAIAAAETPLELPGNAVRGQSLYSSTCAACHGLTGEGITGLGKDLITSSYVTEHSDLELVEFLMVGRPVGDPLNTTGILMPARGGNPTLTDQQLADLVAFVRSIHEESGQ